MGLARAPCLTHGRRRLLTTPNNPENRIHTTHITRLRPPMDGLRRDNDPHGLVLIADYSHGYTSFCYFHADDHGRDYADDGHAGDDYSDDDVPGAATTTTTRIMMRRRRRTTTTMTMNMMVVVVAVVVVVLIVVTVTVTMTTRTPRLMMMMTMMTAVILEAISEQTRARIREELRGI